MKFLKYPKNASIKAKNNKADQIILKIQYVLNLDEIEYFLPTADILAGEGYTNFDYTSVWNSIKNLQVTNDCLNNNGKIGFVLYTPAIGLFQPENAYWLVILYK